MLQQSYQKLVNLLQKLSHPVMKISVSVVYFRTLYVERSMLHGSGHLYPIPPFAHEQTSYVMCTTFVQT